MSDDEHELNEAVREAQEWYDGIKAQITQGVTEMLLERRVSSHFNPPLTDQELHDRGTAELFRLASDALTRAKAARNAYRRERARARALGLVPEPAYDLDARRARVRGRQPQPTA